MASSGMLRHVALVRTDVSEECSASFNRVTRIGELGTTLAVTSHRRTLRRNTKTNTKILVTLMKEALSSSTVLTKATRRNIPVDTIFYCKFVYNCCILRTCHYIYIYIYIYVRACVRACARAFSPVKCCTENV
jgi:hypothetical protein